MGRECSTNVEQKNAYRILVGVAEGKRPLGRQRRGCAENMKMDLREMGMGWTGFIWLGIGISVGLL
jgi:hypothetical protein